MRRALLVAALGLVGTAVALALDPRQALAGYLVAYATAVTVVLGLLCFQMAADVMGATWPIAVRPLVQAGCATLPLFVVLYLPLLASARLYPWADPQAIVDHALRARVLHRQAVMNAPFFFGRAIAFVVTWAALAEASRRALRAIPRDPARARARLRALGSLGLPLVALTGTAAAFDWLMSLSPEFSSTIYGLYVLCGGFAAALALLALLLGHVPGLTRSHVYAIGRLLFAFLVFWAYLAFFQYLLIWLGNKPSEAGFYVERSVGADRWTSWFLLVGHFVAPFFALLLYRTRRSRPALAALGAWLLGCHYVDVHWLVAAARGGARWRASDLPPVLLIGGAAVAFALWRERSAPRAGDDPDHAAALAYVSR